MNKKLVLSVLSTAVLTSMAASAMAAPKAGFYIGGEVDKYYSVDALFENFDVAFEEILDYGFDSVYVDENGKAANFMQAVFADNLDEVLADPTLELFGDNKYAVVGTNDTYDPSKDEDLVKPPAGELKVESVSAINSAQLQVKFSKAVKESTVITGANLNATNVEIAALTGAQPVVDNNATAKLSEDGKTLTITTAAGDFFDGNYTITVKAEVTDEDGNEIEPFSKAFSFVDEVKPTIESVSAKTAGATSGSIDITFSEPVKAGAVIKVDGVSEGVTNYGAEQTVALTNALDASKSHTVEVVNLEDAAGNTTAVATKTFTVEVDANAPQVASVAAKGDNAILVTFNKKVTLASLNSGKVTAMDANTFANVPLSPAVTATPGATTADTQFIIPVNTTLYSSATSRTLNVMFSAEILDELGNKSAAVSKTVTLSKDTTAPVISGLEFAKNAAGDVTSVTVKLNEGVAAMTTAQVSTAAGKVKVLAPDGTDVTATFIDTTVGNQTAVDDYATGVKLAVGADAQNANLQPGAYTFIIQSGFATDKSESGNPSTAFTGTLDFGKQAPTTSWTINPANVSSSVDNTNVITVGFGTQVKGGAVAGSATDPANYSINGKPLPAGTVITLNSPAKDTATITIPSETYTATDADAIFTVANVQNATGVAVTPFTTTLQITDNTKPVLNSAVLNNDGTVTIGFSETLAVAPAAADLAVTINGSVVDDAEVTVDDGVGADAGKYVVTVKKQFDDLGDVATDPAGANDVLFIDLNNNGTYDAGEIVLTTGAANGAVAAADNTAANLKSSVITSLKVGTIASPVTGEDADNNTIKGSVVITVK